MKSYFRELWFEVPARRAFINITLFLLFYFQLLSCSHATDITDSDGNTISFHAPFRRIISLYPAHTENLFYMGAEKEVTGISRGCSDIPGAGDKKVFSYGDDPERLLATNPDLVLIRPMISRAHPAFVEMLRKNGVSVVSLQPVSVEGMRDYWLKLGLLTGREKEAVDMWQDFQASVRAAGAKVAKIPVSRRKRVYFESIHSRMKGFAPGSIAMFVLKTAGGLNAIPDLPQVRNTNIACCGKERILSHAGEIDVYLAQQGRMNRITVDDIMNEPGFGVIKAIREKEVYLIREELVSRPTMHIIDGINRIMEILYGIKDKASGSEKE